MRDFIQQITIIIPYWLIGIMIGALLKTFQSGNIEKMLKKIASIKSTLLPLIVAAIAGAISPITLFGIIPILYAFDIRTNRKFEAILVSFITSSILISPTIFIFTISLGLDIAIIRLLSSIFAGIIMGLVVDIYRGKYTPFLNLNIIASNNIKNKPKTSYKSKARELVMNFWGAFKKTSINLSIGILIAYIISYIIPDSLWELTFRNDNLAVPISAFLSIGLYQCGGGSIPILQGLMREGLSVGAAIAFMIVGPLTKITNLAALKSIMSLKKLIIYCVFLIVYVLIIGLILPM